MTSQLTNMKSSSFLLRFCVSLIKFSYWFKFHVNIMTVSIGMTRNSEIGNTPVWVLPNIWRLGCVMDTKFGRNVSNETLLNAAKCQDYCFYRFWATKGKPTVVGEEGRGGGGIYPNTFHYFNIVLFDAVFFNVSRFNVTIFDVTSVTIFDVTLFWFYPMWYWTI